MLKNLETAVLCYHCGDPCANEKYMAEGKHFCCNGCQTVFEILNQNNLCAYYEIEEHPAISAKMRSFGTQFDFLDKPEIEAQLLDFKNDTLAKITFFIPTIHCSSCLWLLENLHKLNPGILNATVDFLKKQVAVSFKPNALSLKKLVELLASIGYEPLLNLHDVVQENKNPTDSVLLTKLAVAGFCAGNIMLFSFPEYLGLEETVFKTLFGYLNLVLSLPVVFFSGSDYFKNSWKSIRTKSLNIDLPILLGILGAFGKSVYEVVFLNGAGYFDSVSGLIFLLLIGKWFQQKTFDFLSFDRDYTSYFPMAVTRLKAEKTEIIGLHELKKGDKIRLKSQEIIPADGLLYKGDGLIDYSFVTGEADAQPCKPGKMVYAGGRQMGGPIELEIQKTVSQSYFTSLWNNKVFTKGQSTSMHSFTDLVGRYFTWTVLSLSLLVLIFWSLNEQMTRGIDAFISILIVACPCALAISYPFATGSGIRILAKMGFFLKNSDVLEQLARCNALVFDKTGTLTDTKSSQVSYEGKELNQHQINALHTLVSHSTHPLSIKLASVLKPNASCKITDFGEVSGAGLEGVVLGQQFKVGRKTWVVQQAFENSPENQSEVWIAVDEELYGKFIFQQAYRNGLGKMMEKLRGKYETFLLSGDKASEKTVLEKYFAPTQMRFNSKPIEKLEYIEKLQQANKQVVMIGDGLNDAGALKQANVGIAVTENTLYFTPASDAVMESGLLMQLPHLLRYARFSLWVIRSSFVLSVVYNLIGLSYAVSGNLSPLIAAVLMPLSSATMVSWSTIMMHLGKNWFLEEKSRPKGMA